MFLPRSVRGKNPSSNRLAGAGGEEKFELLPKEVSGREKAFVDENGNSSSSSGEEEEVPVVSYSKCQRWPEEGEPVCVVCGRYGAYIVDRTDQDVCSLECKAKHLCKLGLPLTSEVTDSADECSSGQVVGSGKDASTKVFYVWSYQEHPQVAGMTSMQVDTLRSKVSPFPSDLVYYGMNFVEIADEN